MSTSSGALQRTDGVPGQEQARAIEGAGVQQAERAGRPGLERRTPSPTTPAPIMKSSSSIKPVGTGRSRGRLHVTSKRDWLGWTWANGEARILGKRVKYVRSCSLPQPPGRI
jgi:hypothetical protein